MEIGAEDAKGWDNDVVVVVIVVVVLVFVLGAYQRWDGEGLLKPASVVCVFLVL